MKKIKTLAVVISIIVIIAGGTFASKTYASFVSKDSKTNSFKTGTIDIENDENGFTNVTSWEGSEKEKNVQVTNKSKSPALIRVSITPRWVNEDGSPFAGNIDIVKINYGDSEKWINNVKNDGYYYYSEIVKTGEKTESLIKSVSASIPSELAERYKGKKLIVDVRSESVLASVKDPDKTPKTAVYKEVWKNINNDELTKKLDELSGIK